MMLWGKFWVFLFVILFLSSQRYLTSDYLPSTVGVGGVVVFSIILVCCIIIGVLAVIWKTYYGKIM